MLNKPDLPDEVIALHLRETYGIETRAIVFLPIGNDTASFVYRVDASDGQTFFLKARKTEPYLPAVIMPHYLREAGVPEALAPLPTRSGEAWAAANAFTLLLYPFVDGTDGMTQGMTDLQWRQYGDIVRRIHATRLPDAVRKHLPTETFVVDPYWRDVTEKINARIDAGEFSDTSFADAAAFWRSKRDEYVAILHRTERLGRELQTTLQPEDFVLCHSDIHTANILIDKQGGLHVVDWDQPIFAPRERDLMFVVGADGELPVDLFLQGYGDIDINWHTLAFYRYLWVVQDAGDYACRTFLYDDIGADAKANAAHELPRLFEPNGVVDAAYTASKMIDSL